MVVLQSDFPKNSREEGGDVMFGALEIKEKVSLWLLHCKLISVVTGLNDTT